jgi:hypothetical protein
MKPSEILKDIKKKPHNLASGICYNFEYHINNRSMITLHYAMNNYNFDFMDWPEYSGDPDYPIWSSAQCSPEDAYDKYDLWSKKSKYGKLRWQLLDWLIEQFESKGA